MKFIETFKYILTSRFFYISLLFLTLFPPVYKNLPIRIDYTLDSCLPQSVWITYKEFNPNVHKYILFIPKKDSYTQKAKYLLKYVGCKSGQYLETRGLNYYCDGSYISTAKKADIGGKPLSQFIFNGFIPNDKFFAIATHPYAYDSKYFGFVDKSQIERGASPVF
jgi:conjugal transfer pilin signal peptidase TrbI